MRKYIIILSVFILFACSGGGSSSSGSTGVSQGVFIDSAVEGIRYETATQSGLTDVNGTFDYLPGETVMFYVGDILIGSVTGAKKLTPLDLVPGAVDENNDEVTNILRFIQTLDSDANLSNGINISGSVRSALAGQVLDFSLSRAAFEAEFDAINTALLGGLTMVTAVDAQTHMRTTLDGILSGSTGGNGFGSLSITGAAADITAIGSTFSPATAISGSAWLETEAGYGIQFSVRKYNEQVTQVTLVNFGTGPNSFYQYDISCGSIVAGDTCNNVVVNLTARSMTFNNVTLEIGPPSYGTFTNVATAQIVLNGTLYW